MKDYKAGDIVVCVQHPKGHNSAGYEFEKVFTVHRIDKYPSGATVLFPQSGNGVHIQHVLPLLEYIAKKYPVGTEYRSLIGGEIVRSVKQPYLYDSNEVCVDIGIGFCYTKEKGFAEIISKPEEKQTKTMNNKKIIGYKCPMDLFTSDKLNTISKGRIYKKHSDGNYYPDQAYYSHYRMPAEIVEQWEPVYEEPKPQLPEINGYKGEPTPNREAAKYGCATLYKDSLAHFVAAHKCSAASRQIVSFKLSSGVDITVEQAQQIIAALEYKDN